MKTIKLNTLKSIFISMLVASAAMVACDKNKIGGGEDIGEDPEDDHLYVDLGLSVLWADRNVGSENDGDSGFLIAWGELQPKEDGIPYDFKHYAHAEEKTLHDNSVTDVLTKYCSDPAWGTPDYKFFLLPEDDAATQNWGSSWRTATYDEWRELCNPDKCTWEYWKHNSRYGAKVTSKVPGYEGNWIFLPFTGIKDKDETKEPERGWYWTANIHNTAQVWANCKAFSESEITKNQSLVTGCNRACGLAIRPVRDRK